MNILNNWLLYVSLYLVLATVFTQFYKITTKTLTKAGSLTVLLELMAGIIVLFLCPFFEIKFSTDIKVYISLGFAIIFYAITDRLNTTVRKEIEASTFSILKQISTVFMIVAGILFFKESFLWNKMIGATLIIFSNILIFYKKGKFKFDKYVLLGVLSNLSFSIAMFLDVSISDNFNLPIYVAITLIVPAILNFKFFNNEHLNNWVHFLSLFFIVPIFPYIFMCFYHFLYLGIKKIFSSLKKAKE